MNRKELTKTFMMISNGKKPFDLQGFHKKIQRLTGKCTFLVTDLKINSPALISSLCGSVSLDSFTLT